VVQIFEQVATLIRDNRFAEAEKELTAVLRVTPDLPVALNFLGTIRAKQGRLVEAETLFLRAVRNDKNFTGARMNLVISTCSKKHALKEMTKPSFNSTKFSHSSRENAEVLVMLGDAYLAQNNLQKAEENYLRRSKAGSIMPARCLVWRKSRGLKERQGSNDLLEPRRDSFN
jgi:predicted Zn-dependent protease